LLVVSDGVAVPDIEADIDTVPVATGERVVEAELESETEGVTLALGAAERVDVPVTETVCESDEARDVVPVMLGERDDAREGDDELDTDTDGVVRPDDEVDAETDWVRDTTLDADGDGLSDVVLLVVCELDTDADSVLETRGDVLALSERDGTRDALAATEKDCDGVIAGDADVVAEPPAASVADARSDAETVDDALLVLVLLVVADTDDESDAVLVPVAEPVRVGV